MHLLELRTLLVKESRKGDKEDKRPAPSGIQTHVLLITRRVLNCFASTAVLKNHFNCLLRRPSNHFDGRRSARADVQDDEGGGAGARPLLRGRVHRQRKPLDHRRWEDQKASQERSRWCSIVVLSNFGFYKSL